MAAIKAGSVSGYKSHGPERRGDASSPHPAQIGGQPHVRVPFSDVRPLGTPAQGLRPVVAGLARAAARGYRVSRAVQQAQQRRQPGGNGMNWQASPVPGPVPGGGQPAPAAPPRLPPGPGMPYNQGTTYRATAGPAYGGAAWNGGGGPLANAMSGTGSARPAALPPGPGMAYNRGWVPDADQQPAPSGSGRPGRRVIQGQVIRQIEAG